MIFLHSLLVIPTSHSDAPIFLIRPHSTGRFSLQNNCSRGWLPPYLTKIIVRRARFFVDGTGRSHLGLDLVNKVDGQAVQIAIHGFLTWQLLRCETRRCLGKTGFSFSANVVVFPQFCLQLVKSWSVVCSCNGFLFLKIIAQDISKTIPKKQSPSLSQPKKQILFFIGAGSPFAVDCFDCNFVSRIVVYPSFIYSNKLIDAKTHICIFL